MPIDPATDAYAFPSIPMDPNKVIALTQSLMTAGVQYSLGSKADPLSLQAGGFDAIDCSGFVRWAIYHAADGMEIPDGSVTQHEWVIQQGFKASTFEDGKLDDGAIRIAFLTPEQGRGVGHVMLITGGQTCESHGSHGPDRRVWGSEGFMSVCAVYVLTPPSIRSLRYLDSP